MLDDELSSPAALRKRTRLPPTYKLDRSLAPAVMAAVELLHAGVLVRFANDAIVEALIAQDYVPGKVVPLRRASELTTPEVAQQALNEAVSLCAAIDEAMAVQPQMTWALRSATVEHFELVAKMFPKQPEFHWPAPRAHTRDIPATPLRLRAPELYLDALPQWMEAQRTVSTRFGVGRLITLAIERKLENLGLSASQFYRDPSLVIGKLEFKVLPSVTGTMATRSLEERLLAVIQSLEEIACSQQPLDLHAFTRVSERLVFALTSANREE